jgi:hypothetical protein
VEARTASVFAGACHYNGELTTAGREAEIVWHIREGEWNGVTLNGLTVIAAVLADDNLREEKATRRTVLYVDSKANCKQFNALLAAVRAKFEKQLGRLADVKQVPITYARQGDTFQVESKGITKLVVQAMPNAECCKMPNRVWYKPLVSIQNRRVGFTVISGIQDEENEINWSRGSDNTAFYGSFAL